MKQYTRKQFLKLPKWQRDAVLRRQSNSPELQKFYKELADEDAGKTGTRSPAKVDGDFFKLIRVVDSEVVCIKHFRSLENAKECRSMSIHPPVIKWLKLQNGSLTTGEIGSSRLSLHTEHWMIHPIKCED